MVRRTAGWIALFSVLTLGSETILVGCAAETRYRILSKVLDGVPAPGEARPERPRRRAAPAPPLLPEVPPEGLGALPEPEAPRPSYATFEQVQEAFPRDSMGNVDWVAAVEADLIDPRAAIDGDDPTVIPMPLDVHLDPGIPGFEVIFPHEAHTYWLRCDSCHPGIFQMRAGADPITMASIFQGEYCGRCHGKVAFAPATGCPRCHVNLPGG